MQQLVPAEREWTVGPSVFQSLWRQRWLVVAAMVLAAALAYLASSRQAPLYSAHAELLLADPASSGVFGEIAPRSFVNPDRRLRNQAEFIHSTAVAQRAAELLGDVSALEVQSVVVAEPSPTIDLISIYTVHPSPEGAARLANTVADAYQQLVAEEVQANAQAAIAQLESTRAELQAKIDELDAAVAADPENQSLQTQRNALVDQLVVLESRSNQIAVDAALYGSGVTIFEPAVPPRGPSYPRTKRDTALGAVLGFIAAGGFSFWRSQRRSLKATDKHDPAPILRAPLLGQIPDFKATGTRSPIPVLAQPGSGVADAYQFVLSSLLFSLHEIEGSILLVTSPRVGDGKTVTAANLAVAAARDGHRVVLVDGDERARGLSRFGGTSPEPGFTDLGRPGFTFEQCSRSWQISDSRAMPVVPAGSRVRELAGFFQRPSFHEAMDVIKKQGDLVIVDSPPLLAVADTSALAARSDAMLLVVPQGTPLSVLEEIRRHLDFLGTPLLGYVFNRVKPRSGPYPYGAYGYGYGYGAPNGQRGPGRRLKALTRRIRLGARR
jgi:Mrp family chromosome partitioning ATPase/LPS O-antigen subunit length determinant protein (WzzB/FepE family)